MKSQEFTRATIEKAVEAIGRHRDEFESFRNENPNLSAGEMAMKYLVGKLGFAQIEAEEIVGDLKKGLDRFDEQFGKNAATGTVNVKECLEEATINKSAEERRNSYVNILTAIELLQRDAADVTEDEVEAQLLKNAELTEEELLARIEDRINSAISLETLAGKVKDSLNSESISQLAKDIEANKDEYRLLYALSLYVEQREGNLKLSDSEYGISAEQIGALAGASAEAIITNNALADGRIDLATWQKVMKWIIGAALGILLGYVAVLVVANVSFYAMALVLSIFGSGVVSAFVSLVVFCYFVWRSSEMLFGVWSDIMHAYTDFYNKHIAGITAKVTSWVNAVKEWIVRLADKAKSVLAGSSNETGTRQADNDEEQGAHQGELAMA